jgi:hypothetical protein
MKRVDMDLVNLVHSGETWPHDQPPCSRQMIHMRQQDRQQGQKQDGQDFVHGTNLTVRIVMFCGQFLAQ